ncbi:hypothetical protein P0O24_05215 [Methanotrichaceae archaeon M04Ac]|uniref:Ribonuclease PIN domain-containing protein n=1 Tax=Candidatus Methanocrinis alkalitolerans TaxID=3033395 RepID=A0ABT5XE52_9EURY|nr:hypothetical protein [Candidatus Methanocrinis alkalitolerans]MDF0592979.1 hypothetical protein [Candidatus Methanocrinis alkalitolerans]
MRPATVADSSVFICGKGFEGEVVTVPGVEGELLDIGSRMRLQISGARIEPPSRDALARARAGAERTGDAAVLSEVDLELLAKALELSATLATDDYALQNVALHLGLRVETVAQPRIKKILKRTQRCPGCGRPFEGEDCPVCGTTRRKRRGGLL